MAEGKNSDLTLRMPRAEAREKLESQLCKLSDMFKPPIRKQSDYESVLANFHSWDDYTLDLLRSIFENDDVPKEFSSVPHTKSSGGLLGDYCLRLRQTASRHWNKLHSVIERLELYAEPEAERARSRYAKSRESSTTYPSATVNALAESKDNWRDIENEFGMNKTTFGKRINFVSEPFKRTILFRDVEQAYVLASSGFSKPAVILAGGVIEELLREYLKSRNIQPASDKFDEYIKACENSKLLKKGISQLSDSVRLFRNLVHLSNEKSKRHSISKATAKGAVSSVFTIANDF